MNVELINLSLIKSIDIPGISRLVFQLVDASRDHLKNLKWAQTATLGDVQTHLTTSKGLHVILTDSRVCGCLHLWDEGEQFTIGYWLGKEYSRQGIMKAAVGLALKTVNKPVHAHVRLANTGTRAVLEANHFIPVPAPEPDWISYEYIP